MYNNSLEFIKNRWKRGEIFSWLDYSESQINDAEIFDTFKVARNLNPDFFDKHSSKYYPGHNVLINYDPNCKEFEYFSSVNCEHDGTLLFTKYALEELLEKIYQGATSFANTEPKNYIRDIMDYDIEYIVGDIIIIQKETIVEAEDGNSFPGIRESVCIPVKCIYHKHGGIE